VGRVGVRRRQIRANGALIVASTALFTADSCSLRSGGGGEGRYSSRLVLCGTSVGGWSYGSGVVGDTAGVRLEVGLG